MFEPYHEMNRVFQTRMWPKQKSHMKKVLKLHVGCLIQKLKHGSSFSQDTSTDMMSNVCIILSQCGEIQYFENL